MPNSKPSHLAAGPGVAEYHLRRYLWVQLTDEQAAALWLELQAQLQKVGLQETVDEVATATNGKLDTLPRGDVLEAIAQVLTDGAHTWPCNGDSRATSDAFLEKLRAGVASRGYTAFEAAAA